MANYFKLHHLINVFGVTPTFLLPVFTNELNKFYFQEITHDRISTFTDADLTGFAECEEITVAYPIICSVGSPAFYAIQLPDSNYTIGHSREILFYLEAHLSNLGEYPIFAENMREFQAAAQDSNQSNNSLMRPIEIMSNPTIVEHLTLVPKKYHPSVWNSIYSFIFTESREQSCPQSASEFLLSSGFRKLCGLTKDLQNISLHNLHLSFSFSRDMINETEIYENQDEAVFGVSKFGIKAENIFQFFELIKNSDNLKYGSLSTIHLAKRNFFPIAPQIKVIDILCNYTPITYAKRKNIIKPKKRRNYYAQRHLLRNLDTNLWIYSQVYRLFKLPGRYQFLNTKDSLRPVVRDWGLYVKSPADDVLNDRSRSTRSAWLGEFLELGEDIDMICDETKVFWLEIKKLSNCINAIIAQDFFTGNIHFWIKESPILATTLSSFIEGLYADMQSKVSLLLLDIQCDDNPVDDCFMEWLSKSEEKCQFIETPRRLHI